MEENEVMIEEVGAANTEGQAGAQSGESQEPVEQAKKYTDADVDKIIAKKIAKERERLQKLFVEDQQESELDIRERKVLERELRADAKDALIQQGVPYTLANLMDYSSRENMESSMEEVVKIFRASVQDGIRDALRGQTPRTGTPVRQSDDGIRDAFAPRALR